ncbi:helix-turn-helix domain-containing protein [Roseibium alexandrii]|uniref:helix-turn-helix domain-containing protein n=1 Tax=Roseibium alexandrii TaxID=388408 RepID=UPI003752A52C
MRITHYFSQQASVKKNENFDTTVSREVMQNSPMQENVARTILADWLKESLQVTNVSQSELGRRINLTQSKISRIIAGDRGMSATELLAIANALNVPIPSPYADTAFPLAVDAEADGTLEPDYSELSLMITQDLEQREFDGDMPPDDYIETSAILYTMLKQTGAWHPELFNAARDMMARVKEDKKLTLMPFRDYVKSIVVYYKTFVEAEIENR